MDATQAALIEATRSMLNADRTLDVIERILHSAQSLLNAQAASVFLIDNRRRNLEMVASTNLPRHVVESIRFPLGEGVAGWVAQHNETVLLEDLTRDPRYYAGVAKKTGFETRGYLCVPLAVNGTTIGTVQVLNQTVGPPFNAADQQLLENFAVIAALAIEKYRLHSLAVEKERIEAELAVGKAFQSTLLPSHFSPPDPWQIAAFNEPARLMGGDLYDAMPINGKYMVALGDVSGKGPGAAFWMSGFAHVLRFIVEQDKDPIDHIKMLDEHLHNTMPSDSFLTLFLAVFEEGGFRYTSAGHNPMLLLHADGEIEWLGATGLPLSLLPFSPRETKWVEMGPGSRLVLFSDGLTEAENCNGLMYEEKRLERMVRRTKDLPGDEAIHRLIRSVKRFACGQEQSDDLTVMTVTHSGATETAAVEIEERESDSIAA
ncbi:SpoIIE family protein phosphatase [bacterium]|nr:SpoIIE family protein phosphatase [bacterium]